MRTPQSITLLSWIRDSFSRSGAARMFSKELVACLRDLSDNGQGLHNGTADDGQSIPVVMDETWLARQLQQFGVTPRNIRIGNVQAKGYCLADFSQAFACFLNGGSGNPPGESKAQ